MTKTISAPRRGLRPVRPTDPAALVRDRRLVVRLRAEVRRLVTVMHRPMPVLPARRRALRGLAAYVPEQVRALRFWRRVAARLAIAFRHPPHEAQWLCIHRYEGAWNANTGNGYYGGLQMDRGFQQAYGAALLGSKGTADRWTPVEQMWVAERARAAGRGFGPWPNTARRCNLL